MVGQGWGRSSSKQEACLAYYSKTQYYSTMARHYNDTLTGGLKVNYQNFKERQQEEIDNFPLIFAFNNEQLAEGCARLGVVEPEKELYSIGAGGYVRRGDKKRFDLLFKRLEDELQEALKNPEFLLDALTYELANHEYCYTMDTEPALNALGLSREDVKESDQLREILNKAIKAIAAEVTA
jgi:hypothetical protein